MSLLRKLRLKSLLCYKNSLKSPISSTYYQNFSKFSSSSSSTSADRDRPSSRPPRPSSSFDQRQPPPQRRPAWLDQSASASDRSSEKEQSSGGDGEFQFAITKLATLENYRKLLDILKHRRPIPDWARTADESTDQSTTGEVPGGGGERLGYKSILYTAPYLATYYQLEKEFADVCDEWFHQTKSLIKLDTRRGEITVSLQFSPSFDPSRKWRRTHTPTFNLAHQLAYLGRVNRATNGRLVEKLEWRNVSYMCRRMMECGFFTFTFVDVCFWATSGVADLYLSGVVAAAGDNRAEAIGNEDNNDDVGDKEPEDRLFYGDGLRLWLLGMAHYLAAAESKPNEWRHLIGELGEFRASIPCVLDELRQLHTSFLCQERYMPTKTASGFRYLFKLLCNYARIHFDDDVVEDCRLSMERGRISSQLNVPREVLFLNKFAELWLRERPKEILESDRWMKLQSPEQFVPGTWDSWFNAANVVMHQLLLTDDYFKDTLAKDEQQISTTTSSDLKSNLDRNYYNDRNLNKSMSTMRSYQMIRLMKNAVDIATVFQREETFDECLMENWTKLFDRLGSSSRATKQMEEKVNLIRERALIADEKKDGRDGGKSERTDDNDDDGEHSEIDRKPSDQSGRQSEARSSDRRSGIENRRDDRGKPPRQTESSGGSRRDQDQRMRHRTARASTDRKPGSAVRMDRWEE